MVAIEDIDITRFNRFIIKYDECWLWFGALVGKGTDGYGAFWIDGRQELAHRFSYIINIGPIPEGMYILHHCDVMRCVRPEHLFAGTPKENMQDKIRKGRTNSPHGSLHYSTVLDENDVQTIRILREEGYSCKELGEAYFTSRQAITDIVMRRTWKHVA